MTGAAAVPDLAATPVLLPGNMCDERLWNGAAGAVRRLFPGAFDGDTRQDASIPAMAARVLDSVDGPVLPVGFSMGGIVALEMARRAPGRIAAMVLLDTNPSADLPERAAARPRQQAEVAAGRLERIVVEELKPAYLAPENRGNGALLALLRTMAMDLGPETFIRQSEALRLRPDLRAVLPTLDVPVFIGCGEQDLLCPPAWHIAMAEVARRPTLRIVPGAGHMLPLEQPDALSMALREWMMTSIKEMA